MQRSITARRVAGWLGRGLLWLVLGVTLLVVLALVAINLPPLKGVLVKQVNAALAPSFKGRLVLERFGHIDLSGLGGADLRVEDPAGHTVLHAENVAVHVRVPRLVWNLVTKGSEPLSINVARVGIGKLDIQLIDDGNGSPTLAQAFEPRMPSSEESGPAPTLIVEELALERAEIRGALASPGPIDADLIGLKARLQSDAQGFTLALSELELAARQLPSVERLSGRLRADVFLPSEPKSTAAPAAPKSTAAPKAEPLESGHTTTALALRPAAVRRINANFDGAVFDSPAQADLQLVGDELKAAFDAAELSPQLLSKILPPLSPDAPLSAHAKAQGALRDLAFEAQLAQAAARINASGRMREAGSERALSGRVDASSIDLAHLMRGGEKTRLNLGATAELTLTGSGMNGSYRLVSEGSRYGDHAIPHTLVEGNLRTPAASELVTTGKVTIHEPGAPTDIDYRVLSRTDGVLAHVSARTKLAQPERLKTLSGFGASGQISADVDFDGAAERLEANAELDLSRIEHPSLKARRLTASLYASGLAAAPSVRFATELSGVGASGRAFSKVRLSGRGNPEQLALRASLVGKQPAQVDLRAVLGVRAQRVDAAEVIVTDPADTDGQLRILADSVQWGDRIRVEGATIEGPGRAQVSLVYGRTLESLTLKTHELDPVRLARMLGLTTSKASAELSLEGEVHSRGNSPSGKVRGQIDSLSFGKLHGGRADLDLELTRGKLSGQAWLDLGRGGRTDVVVKEFTLPNPDSSASLERLSGELSLKGELDLAHLQIFMPLGGVERARGRLKFELARHEPREAGERASWTAHVASEKLLLVGERKPVAQPPTTTAEQAEQAAPWTLRGIDLALSAAVGSPGTQLEAHVRDEQGPLLDASTELVEVQSIAELAKAARELKGTAFTAKVQVPKRTLEKLPATVRPEEVQGTLALELDAQGTLAAPRIDAHVSLGQFGAKRESTRRNRGLDIELDARYERQGGKLSLKAAQKQQPVLDLKTLWKGDLRELSSWKPGQKSPVMANMNLALDQFPLGVIPELQNRNIRGKVSGRATLEGFGKEARLAIQLATDRLRLEQLTLDKFEASLEAKDGKLIGRTLIDGHGGKANAEVSTSYSWGDQLAPTLDPALEGAFKAQGLRLSAVQPLLTGIVSELDGKLDADIRAKLVNGKPELSGEATLSEGVMQIPSVGQRFDKIDAHFAIKPGSVVVDKLHALGITGSFEAKAEAKLDGLSPTSAKINVSIDEKHKLPLTVEGEAIGDGWGEIETTFVRDDANKTNTIQVDLKKFSIELPDTPPGGVQDLAPADNIRVGFRRRDGAFVAVPLQPVKAPPEPSEYTTVVSVNIESLWVEKGEQAKLGLRGNVKATMKDELDVRGKIETRRGKIDISGKEFEVERGSVTFTGGKPDDPIISAVARYDSPVGYTVFAEYTGTATQGSLRLSSEPSLSQDEILTLLLFGTPDGSFGSGQNGSGVGVATAVSVAGGTAVQGFNRALSDLTNLDVQARVDTSTGSPRPELVLQLTRRVAAKVTQALGEPSPGQSPDRTFLTIELRLASAWSLSTMIGDRGASALDLIWRRRY